MATMQSLGIDTLERDEQLALAAEILDYVPAPPPSGWLTPELLADLQARLDDDDANPDEGTPIEEVLQMMEEMVASRMKP